MFTQITCPNCRTPYSAEVHQVVDSHRTPELKQRLLSGQLNMAVCPGCGAGGQLATALLFHDADHDMFIVHVPQELNLNHVDREKLIGQLAQQAMNDLPAEQRRAYMLQPQMMLSMQSFMEKVLETEGITPEMIARQRKQAELLQQLVTSDKDVADYLIGERISEIDEGFFALLQAYIDAAQQANDDQQLLKFTNLRAKLMTRTPVGQKLEKQQIALHALNRDAKKAEGLSPELLLKHVLANRFDDSIVDALVAAGRGALNYSFFSLLTAEIEKAEEGGQGNDAQRLTYLREKLLKVFDALQQESQRVMAVASETLNGLLAAPDPAAAVMASGDRIDDAFMYLLMSRIAEADQNGNADEARKLGEIHAAIMKQLESQFPPEVMLLNSLIEAKSSEEEDELLTQNAELVSNELLEMLKSVSKDVVESGSPDLAQRLEDIGRKIEARL